MRHGAFCHGVGQWFNDCLAHGVPDGSRISLVSPEVHASLRADRWSFGVAVLPRKHLGLADVGDQDAAEEGELGRAQATRPRRMKAEMDQILV